MGAWKSKFAAIWFDLKSGFWFLPSVMAVGGISLAVLCIWLDHRVMPRMGFVSLFFGGRSDAARELLSSIASASMSVISIEF